MNNIKGIANEVISKLTNKGCQKAQCEIIKSETNEFNVDGNEFSLFRTTYDEHLSMTAYKDNKKGNIKINKLDSASIDNAVESCMEVVESSQSDEAYDIAPHIGIRHFSKGAIVADLDKFLERCKELVNDIKEKHPKIVMEQLIFRHVKNDSLYIDTNNNEYTIDKGQYEISLLYSGHDGEKATSFFGSGVVTDNLDEPFIQKGSIQKDLTDVENQLNTVTLTGKMDGTVIIASSCIPSIFYGVVSSFAGDYALLSGTSIWKDKLNTKVADERLTVSFKPNDEKILDGDSYSQDGFINEDYDLISNGILKSFWINQYVANKTKLERSKNTTFSLVINNGDKSINDMISECEHGIMLGRFSGGEPSTNGDFSGVAKNSFLIEKGKVVGAINEVMISGNLADLLNNVIDISKETVIDGMMVVPYISVKNIVISGK